MTVLRRALVTSSIVWALLLPLAPFAASQPAPARAWYALAFVVYGAGGVLCHQLPERSFFLWSAQWPVCARCTGIYVGAAIAAIFATARLKPDPTRGPTVRLKPDTTYETSAYVGSGFIRTCATIAASYLDPRLILAVALVPTAATLVYEWTTGDMPSHAIRALAGAPLGAAIVVVVVGALRLPTRGGPSVSEWGRTL